jgi:hypothetical protein
MALFLVLVGIAAMVAVEAATLTAVVMWRARRVAEWNISVNDAWVVSIKVVGLGSAASVIVAIGIDFFMGRQAAYSGPGGIIGLIVTAFGIRDLLPNLAERSGVPITPHDARSVALSAVVFWIGLFFLLGLFLAFVHILDGLKR